jgi:hypothetical protein
MCPKTKYRQCFEGIKRDLDYHPSFPYFLGGVFQGEIISERVLASSRGKRFGIKNFSQHQKLAAKENGKGIFAV